jgi:hypothetical protein
MDSGLAGMILNLLPGSASPSIQTFGAPQFQSLMSGLQKANEASGYDSNGKAAVL